MMKQPVGHVTDGRVEAAEDAGLFASAVRHVDAPSLVENAWEVADSASCRGTYKMLCSEAEIVTILSLCESVATILAIKLQLSWAGLRCAL